MKKLLIIHLHGIGDWMMFSSSVAKLIDCNYKIDVITGLDPTKVFLDECGYNVVYHRNLRKRFSAVLIFGFIFLNVAKYNQIFVTAGMSDLKLFLLQFAFIFKTKVAALATRKWPFVLIDVDLYEFDLHKTLNNQKLVFKFLRKNNYKSKLPYFLPGVTKKNIIANERKAIVIHPGNDAKNSYRRYPIDLYCELICKIINNNLSNRIYIVIGPGELGLLGFIDKSLVVLIDAGIVEIVKTPSFADLFRLFQKCDLFITNDSGLAHIAAAFNIRIINIFGPANPSDTSPVSVHQEIIYPKIDLDCMPCVKIGGRYGCKEQTCLRAISTDMLIDAIK